MRAHCVRPGLDAYQPADTRERKRKRGPKQQPAPKPGRRLTALVALKAAMVTGAIR